MKSQFYSRRWCPRLWVALAWLTAGFGLVAVHRGLAIAVDFSGNIYCLDACAGKKFWQHDSTARIFGSPLIVDDLIYMANQDSTILIFALAREKQLIARNSMRGDAPFGSPIHSSPIYANGTLYVVDQQMLYAIQQQ